MKRYFNNLKIPHVFIFLSAIILFCSILTYIVPSGQYERTTKTYNQIEQTVIVPGSYQEIPKYFSLIGLVLGVNIEGKASPTSLLGLFSSIPKGMNQAASLIFFVFTIGAVFNLIQSTGTINIIVFKLLRKFKNSPILLTFILFTVFALSATFLGMGAEFIPLIPILLILSKEMGYDRLFGVSVLLVPMGIGWSTAITNPFTVQIAQKIAELPIGSGIVLRIIMFIVCFLIGFAFLTFYGRKIKNDSSKSMMAHDAFLLDQSVVLEDKPFTKRHFWIIFSAVVLFGLILFAVQTMGWGLIEMTGGFFIVGLLTILISGKSGDESMEEFIKGLQIMIVPALIVGFARGIQVVLQEGLIIDTILFHAASVLREMPTLVAAEGMYLFQTFLNFFIPSASGQAMVSMPLMVPLADLLGITRQTAVLAFISGDGFSNMIIPTNGVLMAILSIALVPFGKWFKFILPLFVVLSVLAAVFLSIAVIIAY
ncbi:MAG: YfcC family protein [Candidatus Cyclobacteriaceae bacterium M3_2C_046]